jgi:hypothetical protein
MSVTRTGHLFLALFAACAIWVVASPAQAQLVSGCTCPAGFAPATSTTCRLGTNTIPAICPFRNLAHITAAIQQQSFSGIDQIIQQRRDQLQSKASSGNTSSKITGYSESNLDTNTLGYSGQAQKNNPLASNLYDDAASSATPPSPTYGTWVQGLAQSERDLTLSSTDAAHLSNTYTGQAGIDRTQQGLLAADDALVIGMVSSWTSSHITYDGMATKADLTGPGVGVYTEYVKGGFSTDVTAKFDFLQMNQNYAGNAPNTSVSILSSGLSGNAQYKVTGQGSNFIEPTVGFSLSHTSFGSGSSALGLEDAYTLRLQGGARVGTSTDLGNGISVDSSLKALIYGDAISQGTSVPLIVPSNTTLTVPIAPADTGMIRWEFDPELCLNLPADFSLTASGQFTYGKATMSEGGGLNLRKQW